MSLYQRFETEHWPSFITTNTYERRPVFSSAPACNFLIETLYEVRRETGFQLIAFALMPDHFHLILVAPDGQLGRIVQLIKGRLARTYNQQRGTSGSVWQSRYHERTLRSDEALISAMQYVNNNPVGAGLAPTPESYRWGTASGRFETDTDAYLSG